MLRYESHERDHRSLSIYPITSLHSIIDLLLRSTTSLMNLITVVHSFIPVDVPMSPFIGNRKTGEEQE